MTPDELERLTTLKARRDAAKRAGCPTVFVYCVYAICEISKQVEKRNKDKLRLTP
jgi:hypothetical protein